MSVGAPDPVGAASADLRQVLESALAVHAGRSVRIASFDRRPSPYRTSAALEEIDVELDEGTRLAIIFKDASFEALQERAQRAKPAFMHNPLREIETYRQVLAGLDLGTPACYGALIDRPQRRYWLFLERVAGVALYEIGDLDVWRRVAAWLARMHRTFAEAGVAARAHAAHALHHDTAHVRLWLARARRFFPPDAADTDRVARGLAWLAPRHERIVDRLAALPATFLHGEFYASNVLVSRTAGGLRICPIDWEMAAVGPALMDLAALTAGSWSEDQRIAIAAAYYDALPPSSHAEPWARLEDFLTDLAYCRVQVALQWLGWFGRRRPPAEHAHDWLGDALEAARQAGL